MDLNTFTIGQLPFQTSDTLPEFCVRHKVDLGKVPDEKDGTNPVPYMDEIFAASGEQPTPIGPKDNEIWYTTTDGEIYDFGRIIEAIGGAGGTYNGPVVVSNEYDEEKQMWCMTFDDDVTVLGDANLETMTVEGPFFSTNPDYSFLVCNVETIILPKTINRIGSYAFGGCTGLTSIEISDSVTSIGDRAFYYCTSLTSLTIGNSVTSIGGGAFGNCSGLTSVEIPNSVAYIGNYAFGSCDGLTSITIPNSVTSIGDEAFQNCVSLTSITIPNSVTRIGYQAFYGCTSLTSVEIPDSITSIGESAFSGCTGLTSIEIPDSITSIGYEAFAECTGLASVTIGNSVTSIGNQAFYGCSGLTSVTCEALTPPTLDGSSVFNNTNDCPIYVPSQSVDAYKAAENWSGYADRIQAIQ